MTDPRPPRGARRRGRPLTDEHAWMQTPPPGWFILGTHASTEEPLEFWGEGLTEDGLPIWERPAD